VTVEKPPRWKDESAVADWVIEKLALPAPAFRTYEKLKTAFRRLIREKKLFAADADHEIKNAKMVPVGDRHFSKTPDGRFIFTFDLMDIIDDAVTKAEHHGDFMDLAILLDPDSLFNSLPDGRTARALLPPNAWKLIVARLTGRHKAKRGQGRPPKDILKRLVFGSVHRAAKDFPRVKQLLRQSYPEQKAQQIRDRALYIAARHHEIKQNTLSNYLRRPLNDRRRLPKSA
jgi:hypothetical protein